MPAVTNPEPRELFNEAVDAVVEAAQKMFNTLSEGDDGTHWDYPDDGFQRVPMGAFCLRLSWQIWQDVLTRYQARFPRDPADSVREALALARHNPAAWQVLPFPVHFAPAARDDLTQQEVYFLCGLLTRSVLPDEAKVLLVKQNFPLERIEMLADYYRDLYNSVEEKRDDPA